MSLRALSLVIIVMVRQISVCVPKGVFPIREKTLMVDFQALSFYHVHKNTRRQ